MQHAQILGVNFCTDTLDVAVDVALEGGLVVAPSGPGLADDLVRSPVYREALCTAELVLTDSGFMVMLWKLITGEKIPRHSGLKFLRAILERTELKREGAAFWVMPSADDATRNRTWLTSQGIPITDDDIYIAPQYGTGEIQDAVLMSRIEARRPAIVVLAIGGGVQERLGLGLRDGLCCRPGILCLGAAIAFLSGGQASIPPWADRMRVGWLLRILSSPRRYLPRYRTALKLAPLLWKNRDRLPAAQWEAVPVAENQTI